MTNKVTRRSPATDRFINTIVNEVAAQVEKGTYGITELAEMFECTRPTIYSWLNKDRPPPVDVLFMMAQLCGFQLTLSRTVTMEYTRAAPRTKMRRNEEAAVVTA